MLKNSDYQSNKFQIAESHTQSGSKEPVGVQ